MQTPTFVWAGVGLLLGSLSAFAQTPQAPPSPKPVPEWQVLPLPQGQAAIERAGKEISRYYFGGELRRPFLFPLIGPAGKSLTRMGHPRDPNGHSHHNSVWVSHHDLNGVSFWADAGKNRGQIVQQRVNRYEDAAAEAMIEVNLAWLDESGAKQLDELRTMRFLPLGERPGEWLLVVDLQLSAPKGKPATFGKTPFGLFAVRMAKTIGVHDGGGMIRNSEGGINEAGVFWKSARWVDYSGPILPGVTEGVTLFDHPTNPNHPTVFHVRDDGWMGSCLTFDGPRTIEPEQPLVLRYGVWVHSGAPPVEVLNARFAEFAKIGPPPPKTVK